MSISVKKEHQKQEPRKGLLKIGNLLKSFLCSQQMTISDWEQLESKKSTHRQIEKKYSDFKRIQ